MDTTHETAEFVLPGHPDKLCDAVVDAIVDTVRRADPKGQCGLEAACVFDRIWLTGRIASTRAELIESLQNGELERLVRETYVSAGYGEDSAGYVWGPLPQDLRIETALCIGVFEDGEAEYRHLSDDQAVCVGYAVADEHTGHLPPAHWFARCIGRGLVRLRAERGAGEVGPDGKVVVRVRRNGAAWTPEHVSISLNHHEHSDWLLLRQLAEEAVEGACAGLATPALVLNGAGMFIAGGPNGDNGLSGKKLVVDAYGPTVPIGGGAWSGKDFHKVDRLGGLLARELALACLHEGLGEEALVTLEYNPGCEAPVHVSARLDGRACGPDFLGRLGHPAIDNLSVWQRYVRCTASLVELARWGHQQSGTPWEEQVAVSPSVSGTGGSRSDAAQVQTLCGSDRGVG